MLSHVELIERIVVAAALGGAIGHERNRHGRPVDLRTHLLVSMTAATFMVVSSQFAYYQHFTEGEGISVDASRIAASVVSATGFLAGGAILRNGATVQGLTTSAGLWLVTAIGLCAGAGMFIESIFVTVLGLMALTLLRRFERREDTRVRRRVALVLGDDAPAISSLTAALVSLGGAVSDVEYERWLDDKRKIAVTFAVAMPVELGISQLIEALESHPGVRRVRVQPA